jgi:predicted phosphodiesterase
MKVLIISDIHANLPALEAVLDHCENIDAVWCLGDLVGYGPDPNECVQRVRSLPNLVCVLGNHDAAALGQIDLAAFNFDAQQSTLWTQLTLTEENKRFLLSLSEKQTIEQVTLCHGSPQNPIWEYVLDTYTAQVNFQFFNTPYCFVGHSHLPLSYFQPKLGDEVQMHILHENQPVTLVPRAILNPGSVGQPRDHDPRASYVLFDTETLEWNMKRAAYPVEDVQDRIRLYNLPGRHALRLTHGW